jgi:hypothetical protein
VRAIELALARERPLDVARQEDARFEPAQAA